MQLLADDFVAHGYDLQRLIRLIAASEAFQRDSRAEFEITEQHERAWAVFPLSRLRPEQMAGSLIQAASLTTINGQAHVIMRIAKFGQTNQFVRRYGDLGEDEFTDRGSTIPQRLLMMNGNLVKERTQANPLVLGVHADRDAVKPARKAGRGGLSGRPHAAADRGRVKALRRPPERPRKPQPPASAGRFVLDAGEQHGVFVESLDQIHCGSPAHFSRRSALAAAWACRASAG